MPEEQVIDRLRVLQLKYPKKEISGEEYRTQKHKPFVQEEPRYTLVVPIEKKPGSWRRKIITEDELHSFVEAWLSGNTHSDRFYVERMRAGEPADSVTTQAPL